ncbi:DUF4352 domain-containing protein [Bacillus thuringiensis]|uniref:DUF4352 domain-containing protein n=1 Tax=Bacillus thuringiensis TaxID=1428 RepID=UPI000BFC7B33|nr:DUF4352 domain-containing protein [Bacillus thuringiensis]PGR79494.1 DUF4352 domain-containing protein [Bacillus thuringiensis]
MEVEKKSKVWEYIGWGSFILVGSFLFFCALILVFGDPKTKHQAQEVTTEGQKVKDAEKDTKKEYSIGKTIKMGDHRLTVTDVKKSSGGEFDKPKQGYEYVLVAVNIYNGGKDDISYNPFDFEMRNSQGNITRAVPSIINQNTQLSAGQLAPNGQVAGTVVFEQPIGEKLKLQFTPNFWSKKKIIINL